MPARLKSGERTTGEEAVVPAAVVVYLLEAVAVEAAEAVEEAKTPAVAVLNPQYRMATRTFCAIFRESAK